jgi:hypothetical protein
MLYPTPHAAKAIVAQMDRKADCTDAMEGFTEIAGDELADGSWTFVAYFTTDWEGPNSDHPGQADYYEATCKMIGAWAYDPDAETVITFAGNRGELVEVIGRAVVDGWERGMGQHLCESGPGDNGDDAYDFWKDCA